MAITEPRVWDACTIQWAAELPFLAGLAAAVGKVLLDIIWAVIDVVTRAGAACRRWALPILGTGLYLALLIAAIRAVLVTIAAPTEGHAEATGAALESGGRAKAGAGA